MVTNYFAQSKLLWKPDRPKQCPSENLRRMINRKYNLKLVDFNDLYQYSIEDYNFWLDLWEYLGIISSVSPRKGNILVDGLIPEVPIWFPDARLNYAENLLHRRDDAIAVTESGESGMVTHYTFRELHELVREMAAALRVNGLQVGDIVAGIFTNQTMTLVIALAATSIGGIFSNTAADMGAEGILDRYVQIKPKFLFCETEVLYAGQTLEILSKISEVVKALSNNGLEKAILLPSRVTKKDLEFGDLPKSTTLAAFLKTGDSRPLLFEQLPVSQPLFIVYSSGTSGKPKCIVHSAGGILLQIKKDLRMGHNLGPDDVTFYHSSTGWSLWNLFITSLSCGSRVILYDGSPYHPDAKTYLKFINNQGVSVYGTNPRFLFEIQTRGIKPLEVGTFETLRVILSTGAVLNASMFEWTHAAFGGKSHLYSMYGGTDIMCAFVTGNPNLPVYSGEVSFKSLGMKVEVFDLSGRNIEHTGQPGELVCTRPHPSLPLYFGGDPLGNKYREAYYNHYPGIWRQSDFVVVNPTTKGIIILGRSDGVLNPGGVRFGSSEIYTVMDKFTKLVEDSLCIGQRRAQDNDENVILFLKMRKGHELTTGLIFEIKDAIKTSLSVRHMPSYVFEVPDIPYTVNGKKIEIAVKQIISGTNIHPSGTVANPECLLFYYKYRDIENLAGLDKGKL